MGTVYEAEQVSLKRKVALKLLPPHLSFSDGAIQKFRREAEAGGRQSHPGIVAIHAVGEHEGVHFIVQELVENGKTLADKLEEIRKTGDQPAEYFREVVQLIVEIASALGHAHDTGVIHRDIKPSNILLTADGTPKVTDFGLAKIEDALALSRTGEFAGTPYYMSPEQAMSRRMGIDHRTDIFSLGVTLYEMLTLERPFSGKTSHEVLKNIMLFEPADPHKVNRRVPRDLSIICLKALEKRPEDRFQSMGDLAADLRRFAAGEEIESRSTGAATRFIRRIKRHPTAVVAVGATAALCVTVLILLEVGVLQLSASSDRREDSRTKTRDNRREEVAGSSALPTTEIGDAAPEKSLLPVLDIILHRRDANSSQKHNLDVTSARYDDDVRLRVRLEKDSYCYLIAFNPDGNVQLCYPDNPSKVPRKVSRFEYPEDSELAFGLTDGVGLQAFVLLVSDDPLPAYETWKSQAGLPRWQTAQAEGTWRFNGIKIIQPNVTRGVVRPLLNPPDIFTDLCTFYRTQPVFDAVRAVAFPVMERIGAVDSAEEN